MEGVLPAMPGPRLEAVRLGAPVRVDEPVRGEVQALLLVEVVVDWATETPCAVAQGRPHGPFCSTTADRAHARPSPNLAP
eukprot:1315700-Alexandrium_andersonii.AAC.1